MERESIYLGTGIILDFRFSKKSLRSFFGILDLKKNEIYNLIKLCELKVYNSETKPRKNLAFFAVKFTLTIKKKLNKKIYELRESKGYCSEISSRFI